MRPDTARATASSQLRRPSTRQISRRERAAATEHADATSTAAAARSRGVARSTLRGWRRRRHRDPDRLRTSAFFESTEGAAAVQRIVLAAVFVFGVVGGAGAGLLRLFVVLAGLGPWVACSESSLRRTLARMVGAIGSWGDRTTATLGAAMSERLLTVALDETWKGTMILVAMDVVSGFVLAETHAQARDGATWRATMTTAIAGLKVKLVHAVADEAKGIAAYVASELGMHRSSDLFHGLYELGPVCHALHRKQAQAAQHAAEATEAHRQARGTPRESVTREAQAQARAEVRRTGDRVEVATTCLRDLSATLHPIDLATGDLVSAEQVRARQEQQLARIVAAAEASDLGTRAFERLQKVQRLVPTWASTVAWWHGLREASLRGMALPAALADVVRAILVPLTYLSAVRSRATQAAERGALDPVIAALRAKLDASAVWAALGPDERERLHDFAVWVVGMFVRASSCVEGRNGMLALRYHHRRALPPELLKALTVVHNYVLQRDDGTTAAERFFGASHDDLFEHLVDVMPPLPRPRASAA